MGLSLFLSLPECVCVALSVTCLDDVKTVSQWFNNEQW